MYSLYPVIDIEIEIVDFVNHESATAVSRIPIQQLIPRVAIPRTRSSNFRHLDFRNEYAGTCCAVVSTSLSSLCNPSINKESDRETERAND